MTADIVRFPTGAVQSERHAMTAAEMQRLEEFNRALNHLISWGERYDFDETRDMTVALAARLAGMIASIKATSR
jgi:hypothetical protein